MSDSCEAPLSLYHIELLREDNWLPWKRRITGILCDRNLLKFVDGTAKKPAVSDPVKDGEEAKVTASEEGDSRARTQLELTLSDAQMVHIVGAKSACVASIGGSKYYISFTDDHSRHCTPLFMKNKHEAFDKMKEYITHIERKFGTAPKYLQVDNGKELISQKVKDWLKSKGIELQNSAPYSLEQIGVME